MRGIRLRLPESYPYITVLCQPIKVEENRVLPFYETLGVPVGAILTDNGREFCGRPEYHPY